VSAGDDGANRKRLGSLRPDSLHGRPAGAGALDRDGDRRDGGIVVYVAAWCSPPPPSPPAPPRRSSAAAFSRASSPGTTPGAAALLSVGAFLGLICAAPSFLAARRISRIAPAQALEGGTTA